jgi:hypothetical protein
MMTILYVISLQYDAARMLGHNDARDKESTTKRKKVESDSILLKGKIQGIK